MTSGTTAFGGSDNSMFMALIPVLIQCFGLIFLGFIAGKLKILTNAQAKGLGVYVTSFALPAIFFTVMVSIDFSGVDWYVVLAVSVAKAVMFFVTLAIVLIVSRGKSIGLAGICAIFTSQSNDVALAYPVLRLLFPDLASYIYLFAPAQLVILNPFGYFALEWHRAMEKREINSTITQQTSEDRRSPALITCKRILKVLRLVASNPLFFMTVIGVVFNFILRHRLPDIVKGFFNDLGASFSATALFYLGITMVGRLQTIDRRGTYVLVFILIGKVILSPFVTREVAVWMLSHQPRNISLVKSSFAFLYAAAPTAPPVFLFASKFGVVPEVIGAGLVIGTFIYAPIMFIFAGMATLVNVDTAVYDSTLEKAAIYLSWSSLLCCIWTLAVLVFTKRSCRTPPHRFLVCLLVSIMIFCFALAVGSIWNSLSWDPKSGPSWAQYIKFLVFFIACTGSRVWTALMAIALLRQVRYPRHLTKRTQVFIFCLGFLVPVAVAIMLVVFAGNVSVKDINPAFHYGRVQQICSFVVLLASLLTCFVTLPLTFVSKSVFPRRNSIADESPLAAEVPETRASEHEYSPLITTAMENQPSQSNHNDPVSSPPLPLNDDFHDHHHDHNNLSNPSETEPTPMEAPPPRHELHSQRGMEIHRFIILLILLMIGMFFGVCICLWRLVREVEGGVFIVVEFLDQAFNFGQGILVFAVFGINIGSILTPLANCVATLRYWLQGSLSRRSLHLVRQVKEEEVERFVDCQLATCMTEIASSLRLPGKTLEWVFNFEHFHQWVSQQPGSRQQSRELTSSLLMALCTRNLIRRLNGESERRPLASVSNAQATLSSVEEESSHLLFQYLGANPL